MPRSCAICGNEFTPERKRAKEHIIPGWLLRELSITNAPVVPTVTGSATGIFDLDDIPDLVSNVVRQRGPHTLDEFVEGRVCKPCNNVSLNRFETDARPVLEALIRRKIKVQDLPESERVLVARWGLKTALIFQIAFDVAGAIPLAHIGWLKSPSRVLPEGVSVFAQQHENNLPFYWMGGSTWTAHTVAGATATDEEMLRLSKSSYKFCMQLGPLLLLTAYWPPVTNWSPGFWATVHIPYWRDSRVKISYKLPRDQFPWKSSADATVAFSVTLRIYKLSEQALEAQRYVPMMSKSGPVALKNDRYEPVKVGRNAPCPCGSGVKFKYCHGKTG